MARSQRSNPLQELRALHKARDAPALRQLFCLQGEELAIAAGVLPSGFARILQEEDSDIIEGAGELVVLTRERAKKLKQQTAQTEARQAAENLRASAVASDYAVHLDPGVLLGPLLAAPTKYVEFNYKAVTVVVEKSRLVRVRALSRRFEDLRVHLSVKALCFRWRSGRGGLNLFTSMDIAPASKFSVNLERQQVTRSFTPLRCVLDAVLRELQHAPLP